MIQANQAIEQTTITTEDVEQPVTAASTEAEASKGPVFTAFVPNMSSSSSSTQIPPASKAFQESRTEIKSSFFKTASQAFAAASLLFLVIFGAVAVAQVATSNTKFFSQDALSDSSNCMKKVVQAWRNGKTVFLDSGTHVVSLSPTSGDTFWSISDESNGNGGYTTIYNYSSRGGGILFQASCISGHGDGYGSGKSGSCTFEPEVMN